MSENGDAAVKDAIIDAREFEAMKAENAYLKRRLAEVDASMASGGPVIQFQNGASIAIRGKAAAK